MGEYGQEDVRGQQLKRRGLIAGAAALVAGMLAKQTTEPVAAAGSLVIDAGNQGSATTYLTSPGSVAFDVASTQQFGGVGISGHTGSTGGIGVKGLASTGVGVQGGILSDGTGSPLGVQGINYANTPGATGVQGLAFGTADQTFGIEGRNYGNGNARIGVLGTIGPEHPNTLTTGVVGLNQNTGPQAYGVFGQADTSGAVAVQGQSAHGTGVLGSSSSYIGVYGLSSSYIGVVGYSTQSNGVYGSTSGYNVGGVVGVSFANGSAGIIGAAAAGVAGAQAASFIGPVYINGQMIVTGSKSAAVPHPDGTHRLLYCVESPESWFEDFGEATLVNGKAAVKLDPDFAAVVDTSAMHVFPVSHDPNGKGLAVATRHADGFEVREHGGGNGNSTFSYRVVAKRKDITGERLAKVTLPQALAEIKPAPVPKRPEITLPDVKRPDLNLPGVSKKP